MRRIQIGDYVEDVIERSDYPMDKVREILGRERIGVIGYGPQGHGQSLNCRDNGIEVVVGQRRGGNGWKKAVEDGWEPGVNLIEDITEVVERSTLVMYLLSDAGQGAQWPNIKPHFKPGDAICFSHGFALTYNDQTGVVPPPDIDVILVAPKGSGTTVRRLFLEGRGDQFQLRGGSGLHGPRPGALPGLGNRHRVRVPFRDRLQKGGLQRPDG